MIEVRDTRKAAAARKRARRQAKLDPVWLAMVAEEPCVVTGQRPVELHHYPPKSKAGWSDWDVVPLTPEMHRGKFGYHTLGARQFQEMHGIDLVDEIRKLKQKLGLAAHLAMRDKGRAIDRKD